MALVMYHTLYAIRYLPFAIRLFWGIFGWS
jgi:hypothetical protein